MLNTGEKVDLEGGNGSRSANAVILDLTHQIEKPILTVSLFAYESNLISIGRPRWVTA